MNKRVLIISFLASLLASFLLYGNTLKGDFVYDDYLFAARPELRQVDHLGKIWSESYLPKRPTNGVYRPLTLFTFNSNFILFGDSTFSFHFVNILLNAAVIALVYGIVFLLFKNQPMAFFCAAIFAVLPIHTEAVAFIKSRDELLASFFGLLSWMMFMLKQSQKPKTTHLLLSLIFFSLAVLAKETVVILPFLFITVFWIQKKASARQLLAEITPFIILIIAYLFLRFLILKTSAFGVDDAYFIINPLQGASYWVQFWTACKILFTMFIKTFIPFNLSASYHFNHLPVVVNPLASKESLAGLLLLTIILFAIFFHKRLKNSYLSLGLAAFFIPYFMTSKFIFKGGDLAADRWLYLPSLGLSIIIGYLLYLLFSKQKFMTLALLAAIVFGYSLITIQRNKVWLSDQVLYQSMVRDAPNSAKGRLNLATTLYEKGNIDAAKKQVLIASTIYKDHPTIYFILGTIAANEKKLDQAERLFLKAHTLDPLYAPVYKSLGQLYFTRGEYQKAKDYLKTYIDNAYPTLMPQEILIYAYSLAKLRQYQKSLEILDQYPDKLINFEDNVTFLKAVNYYRLGQKDKAEDYLDFDSKLPETQKIELIERF